jgi:hypothetical protein
VPVQKYGSRRGQELCFKVLVGRFEGNKALGRHRRRWGNNIEMVLEK